MDAARFPAAMISHIFGDKTCFDAIRNVPLLFLLSFPFCFAFPFFTVLPEFLETRPALILTDVYEEPSHRADLAWAQPIRNSFISYLISTSFLNHQLESLF